MSSIRIAVASTPLTATLDEAVPFAVAAIAEAGRLEAAIVCLPESGLPGHRVQTRHVPDVDPEAMEAALSTVGAAAREAGVMAIVGSERRSERGREIVAVVFDADGTRIGTQGKTQIDPTEEAAYVPASGRCVFTAGGATFGIAICHEAFRYPEISRALVLAGAQILFVPHFVTTDDGSLPTAWCDPSNPYNEKALLMRALENGVYVAAANVAGTSQGSATGVISPDGRMLTMLAYGEVGVTAVDIDLSLANRTLALRWAPERNTLSDPRS